MLKKLSFLFVISFLAVTFVNADILVNAGGKIQRYPDGSTLNVAAAKTLSLKYYGIRIVVPKGEKISLRFTDKDEGNMVYCSGNKFKNIKIGDSVFFAEKKTSFAVSLDGKITVDEGSLAIKDAKENVVVVEQGDSYTINIGKTLKDSSPRESKPSKSSYEQIQKDNVLSPSAPRN